MAWKAGKQIELNNSHQIATWRQVLTKESTQMKGKTEKELHDMGDKIDQKNNYMHLFKSGNQLIKETVKENKEDHFVFDQVKYDEVDRPYCQKAKRESLWNKEVRPRDEPKAALAAPLTTSQVYGWRPPIDDMVTGHNRSGIVKRTFMDNGHLQ
eukprot:CAMPEP_0170493050 /NCGR_PEP_ID=MMETSP0208-20121228/13278_1 /TAXON_ID=197538 /ORGANISM="Strombidium inclinatum, Strain S3" /LENGTH=153 /DNA_ID=CAMNT_0010768907 /DNA_START=18 /DNA_END=479 /DNA_ORIENTATION=+